MRSSDHHQQQQQPDVSSAEKNENGDTGDYSELQPVDNDSPAYTELQNIHNNTHADNPYENAWKHRTAGNWINRTNYYSSFSVDLTSKSLRNLLALQELRTIVGPISEKKGTLSLASEISVMPIV